MTSLRLELKVDTHLLPLMFLYFKPQAVVDSY